MVPMSVRIRDCSSGMYRTTTRPRAARSCHYGSSQRRGGRTRFANGDGYQWHPEMGCLRGNQVVTSYGNRLRLALSVSRAAR